MAGDVNNYTVQKGDTLWGLASKYKTQLGGGTRQERSDALQSVFGKDPKSLKPGDTLDLNAALSRVGKKDPVKPTAAAPAEKQANTDQAATNKPLAFKPEEPATPQTPLQNDVDQAILGANVDQLKQQTDKTIAAADKTLAATPPIPAANPTEVEPGIIRGKDGADTHRKLTAEAATPGKFEETMNKQVQISPQYNLGEVKKFAQADIALTDKLSGNTSPGELDKTEIGAMLSPLFNNAQGADLDKRTNQFMQNVDGVLGKKDGKIDADEYTVVTAALDAMDAAKGSAPDGKFKAGDSLQLLHDLAGTPDDGIPEGAMRESMEYRVKRLNETSPGFFTQP